MHRAVEVFLWQQEGGRVPLVGRGCNSPTLPHVQVAQEDRMG